MAIEENESGESTGLREREIALSLRQEREGKTSDAVEGWDAEGGPPDKSGDGLK